MAWRSTRRFSTSARGRFPHRLRRAFGLGRRGRGRALLRVAAKGVLEARGRRAGGREEGRRSGVDEAVAGLSVWKSIRRLIRDPHRCRRRLGLGKRGRLALGKVRAAAAAAPAVPPPPRAGPPIRAPGAPRAERLRPGCCPGPLALNQHLSPRVSRRIRRLRHRSRRRRIRARVSDARRSSRRRLRWTVVWGRASRRRRRRRIREARATRGASGGKGNYYGYNDTMLRTRALARRLAWDLRGRVVVCAAATARAARVHLAICQS